MVELVVAAEHDEAAPGHRQRVEHLLGRLPPDLRSEILLMMMMMMMMMLMIMIMMMMMTCGSEMLLWPVQVLGTNSSFTPS